MRRLWRRLLPNGQGSRSWAYCEAAMRGLPCVVRGPHGYRHVDETGFRWAA